MMRLEIKFGDATVVDHKILQSNADTRYGWRSSCLIVIPAEMDEDLVQHSEVGLDDHPTCVSASVADRNADPQEAFICLQVFGNPLHAVFEDVASFQELPLGF